MPWRILRIPCIKCRTIIETTSICDAKCPNCGYKHACYEAVLLNPKVYKPLKEVKEIEARESKA